MSNRVCAKCEHYSRAITCLEKPVWGLCMKTTGDRSPGGSKNPRFVWGYASCADFRPHRSLTPIR